MLQVTGGRHAYGACGVWIQGGIADTPPRTRGVLAARRVNIFAPADPTAETAAALLAGEVKPLTVKVVRW